MSVFTRIRQLLSGTKADDKRTEKVRTWSPSGRSRLISLEGMVLDRGGYLTWPKLCVCCCRPADQTLPLSLGEQSGSVRHRFITTWETPYCASCKHHATHVFGGFDGSRCSTSTVAVEYKKHKHVVINGVVRVGHHFVFSNSKYEAAFRQANLYVEEYFKITQFLTERYALFPQQLAHPRGGDSVGCRVVLLLRASPVPGTLFLGHPDRINGLISSTSYHAAHNLVVLSSQRRREYFNDRVLTAYYKPDSNDKSPVNHLSQQEEIVLADGLPIPEFDLEAAS